MTVTLSLFAGAGAQFLDNSGNVLTGGLIYSYAAGTTTPLATYTSSAGSTAHANPIILDASGRVPGGEIWVVFGSTYKFVLKDTNNVLIATYDNITGNQVPLTTTNITYTAPLTNAVSETVTAKLSEIVSVKDFGAKGDGATDDTTAIKNAIAATLTANGGQLYFPSGTYLISDKLTIPSSTQWTISGASRGSVIIKQNTNNTPIFYFTQNNIWGWTIQNLTGTWAVQQGYTNTASIMFSFYAASNDYSWYNFQISNIYCSNGFRTISHAPNSYGAIWGCNINNIVHAGSMTGGCVYLHPTVSIGQPNITLNQLYIRADNMDISESCILIEGGDSINLNAVEVNVINSGGKALQLNSSSGTINSFKAELITYGSGPIAVFNDSQLTINSIKFIGVKIAGTSVYGIQTSSASNIVVNNYELTFSPAISGKFYAFSIGNYLSNFKVILNCISGLLGIADAYLTNVGSTASAESIVVSSWQNIGAQINGDTDLSLSIGNKAPTQVFSTNLSTTRSVTLTDQAAGNDSNLFVGFTWTIVNQQPTYANPLLIKDFTGATIGTLASNGFIKLTWYRFGWVVTGYSVWTGTAP
jgi:hypothetical protein